MKKISKVKTQFRLARAAFMLGIYLSTIVCARSQTFTKVTGTAFGTAPWANCLTCTFDKVFDTNTSTYFDAAAADGAYAGIDAASGQVIKRIRYFPRAGQEGRMWGGKFQGSNTSSSAGFVDLYTITATPILAWQQVDIPNTTAYRYIRYLSPNFGHGNVAEVEFYIAGGTPGTLTASPNPMNFGAAAGSSTLTITSNANWTITDNQPWISLSTGSGSNNGTVSVSVFVNPDASPRNGTVTITGNGLSPVTVTINQSAGDSGFTKVPGTAFGTTPWPNCPTCTFDKVFDNNTSTYFDAALANGAYAGIDAGSGQVIKRVRYYPRGGNEVRMVGGKFQGSNTSNSSGYVDLYTVPSTPSLAWQQVDILNTTAYRYLRYLAPNNGYGNVAEVEFYISGGSNNLTLNPTNLSFGAAAGSSNITVTSNVTWTANDDQPWISLSTGSGTVSVSVLANPNTSPRNGTVTITGSGLSPVAVSVTQQGTTPPGAMTPGTNLMRLDWYNGWQDFFAAGVNWSTTTNPWNPTFISDLQASKVKCLRFMDWVIANNTDVTSWNQRIPKTANHYNTAGNNIPCLKDEWFDNQHHWTPDNSGWTHGVAYEWQIDLCNRIDADMWVNVPTRATADFVFQLAQLINSQLEPGLKVYIEWANEVWNWNCYPPHYAWAQSDALGLTGLSTGGVYNEPWWKYKVYASVRAFQQFENVFGINSPRLVKVIAGQVGYHWDGHTVNHMILGDLASLQDPTINPNGITINAYAMAPYMGGQTMAAQDAAIDEGVTYMTYAKNTLNGTGIKLICYEGGSDNYVDANLALAHNSQQEQLYIEYLNAMAPLVNGVFNQFCLTGGTWGIKAFTGEAPVQAPKWRGWVNYWNSQPGARAKTWNDLEEEISDEKSIRIYPNPVKKNTLTVDIYSDRNADAKITLITSNNQRVVELQKTLVKGNNSIQIPVEHLHNGLHLLIINKGYERVVKKVVVER